MIIEAPRYERIDGTDFRVGSRDHTIAVAARETRLDVAYVSARGHLVEDAARFLRGWSGFRHREDANEVAFFGQQLVALRGRVERVIHEKLRIREFLQIEGGYDRGAQVYGKQIDDEAGEAEVGRLISDDAPAADVESDIEFDPFVWVYSKYEWSAEELDAANFARIGPSLLQRKAAAMAGAIARKLERIGRSGNAKNSITGFFNNSEVTVHTHALGEHTSTATAAEMISDLNDLESALTTLLGDNTPDEYGLLVPTTVDHRYRTVAATSNSDLSVAEWFLSKSRRFKKIIPYGFLDTAVQPDIAGSDAPMSMAMPLRPGTTLADEECVFWPFSVEYEERPAKDMGERMRVRGASRCAGVDFRHPKKFLYIINND